LRPCDLEAGAGATVTAAVLSTTALLEATPSAASSSGRLRDIDRAKSLAIILVVIGHIAARDKPSGADWYVLIQFLINSFHMPFFMYLAGYIFFYSGNAVDPRPTYLGYVRRRAERLLIPFFAVGVLIVAGKFSMQALLHVDNWAGNTVVALRNLIWDTGKSPAESIWFVFVLFVYCISVPFLLRAVGNRLWLLLVGAAITYFLAAYLLMVPSNIYLDRIATYLIFFLLGGLAQRQANGMAIIDGGFPLFLFLFAVSLTLLSFHIFEDQAFVLCNFLGIPATHGLVRRIREGHFLLWLSQYVFVIYLLNTIFIGLGKGMVLQLMPPMSFLLLAPILGLAGLLGPILTKRILFRRLPIIDRMTS
jgi:fucose 4-O-acetylase-like acetyltransferase